MTNKKFKIAAMSMALTACVAAQPLMASAAETDELKEPAADVNANADAAPQAEAAPAVPEAPKNTEAAEDEREGAFGPGVDSGNVEIDYQPVEPGTEEGKGDGTEEGTDDKTTTEKGPVIDTSKKDETTGETGEIGEATKKETETGTTTDVQPGQTTTGTDIIEKDADGNTTITTPTVTEETTTTTTTGTGSASSETDTEKETTDKEELSTIDLDKILGKDHKDYEWGTSEGKLNGYDIDGFEETGENTGELTLSKTEESDPKDLSAEDIAKLLDVDKPDVAEDGTYTLVRTEDILDENGNKIGERTTTYKITGSTVTTWTTTTLTIRMEKGTAEDGNTIKSDTGDADLKDDGKVDLKDGNDKTVETVKIADLITVKEGRTVTPHYDENGTLTGYTVTEDGKTYEITFAESSSNVDLSDLTNEQLRDFLNKGDKKGYYVGEDRELYDADGNKLSLEEKTSLLNEIHVTVTVTRTETGSTDWAPKSDDEVAKAKEDAKKEAIYNALKDAIGKDERLSAEEKTLLLAQLESDKNEDKLSTTATEWGHTDTVSGKSYTYKYSVGDTTTSEGTAGDTDTKRTDTVDGTAHVEGSTIIWTESGKTATSDTVKKTFGDEFNFTAPPAGLDLEGEAEYYPEGHEFAGKLKSFTTKDGKTYTFTYSSTAQQPDGLPTDGTITSSSFTEVKWTITEKTTDEVDKSKADLSTGDKWDFDEKSGTLTIKRANSDDEEKITGLTYDEDKKAYKDADGNLYTLTETTTVASQPEVEAWLRDAYKNDTITVKSFDAETGIGTATYKDADGVEHTIEFESGQRTLLLTKTTTETVADVSKEKVADAIRDALKNLKEDEELEVGGKKVTLGQDGKYLLDGITEEKDIEYVVDELTKIVSSFANYHDMSPEQIADLLRKQYAQAIKDEDIYENGNQRFDHSDLTISTTLKDETGKIIDEDAMIIGTNGNPPLLKYGKDADAVANKNGTYKSNIPNDITWDNGRQEYRHEDSNVFYGNGNYYSLEGQVVYGCVGKNLTKEQADAMVKNNKGKYVVKVGNSYRVYENKADLVAFGYMSKSSNGCTAGRNLGPNDPIPVNNKQFGYDLKVDDLTLINGKVVPQVKSTYSATLKKSKRSNLAQNLLEITGLSHVSSTTDNGLFGSYDITYTKPTDFTETSTDGKGVAGTGKGFFTSIRKFFEKTFTGTADGTRYEGKLNYTYRTTDSYDAEVVSKKDEYHTVANVTYEYTTVETKTTYRDDSTVVVVPPTILEEEEKETIVPPQTPELPPVQDAKSDDVVEIAVPPTAPVLPAVQDAHALPQTGVNWWTALSMAISGMALMAAGAFTSLTGKNARH